MHNISFEVMAKHLVQISSAITDARKDLVERGMTGINSDMYSYLKKAQNDIDVLRHAIRPSQYTTVSGDVAHGYVLGGYKVGQNYYGHVNFGHTDCREEGQKRVSIPLEEFEKFVHEIPFDCRCAACGRKVLLLPAEQSEPRVVESETTEAPKMLLGLHIVANNQERSGGDDPLEDLSFEEAIDPANWIEEQRLDTPTFEACLQADGTLYLGGVALREGFSPEAAQALIRFLSERVKLPVVEPPYEFPPDFTPQQVDIESEDIE